jgi:hypothetical protein
MAVTLTIKLHEALAASVAPVRLAVVDPAVAVIVPPPQLPESALGVDTVRPAGRLSVKPMPESEVPPLGLDRLKVSVVAPFNATVAAPNDFAIVGGRVIGGGGPTPEEPPPHAKTHGTHKIMNIIHVKRRFDCLGTFPLTTDEEARRPPAAG